MRLVAYHLELVVGLFVVLSALFLLHFGLSGSEEAQRRIAIRHAMHMEHIEAQNTGPHATASLGTSFRHQEGLLRTAVVNSCGSAACRRCWPIGDNGVLTVGMLLVVKRRCSCPRTSLALELVAWEPKVLRSGEVRPRPVNDDCSSRGERRPPRSPMPVEKAMVN
jgi:hypothetical protein